MKLLFSVFLFLLSLQTFAQDKVDFTYAKDFPKILELTKQESSPLYYPALLNRYQQGDTSLTHYEVLALQIGYTNNENYWPYQDIDLEREIWKFNEQRQYDAAIKACDSLFSRNPFSLLAAREKSYAFHKLGVRDSADFYYTRFDALVRSNLATGDGNSYETSWFVLSPADGKWIIELAFRKNICSMGSGRDSQGNFHDILGLELNDEEDKEKQLDDDCLNVYFNIAHAAKRMFGKEGGEKIKELLKEDN